jgi:hypothetical protein
VSQSIASSSSVKSNGGWVQFWRGDRTDDLSLEVDLAYCLGGAIALSVLSGGAILSAVCDRWKGRSSSLEDGRSRSCIRKGLVVTGHRSHIVGAKHSAEHLGCINRSRTECFARTIAEERRIPQRNSRPKIRRLSHNIFGRRSAAYWKLHVWQAAIRNNPIHPFSLNQFIQPSDRIINPSEIQQIVLQLL